MPFCVVKSCKNYAAKMKKKDGVSYFNFPRDAVRRDEWRSIIAKWGNDESFQPKDTSVICSAHFSEDAMYLTERGNRRRLVRAAVPSLMLADETPEIPNEAPSISLDQVPNDENRICIDIEPYDIVQYNVKLEIEEASDASENESQNEPDSGALEQGTCSQDLSSPAVPSETYRIQAFQNKLEVFKKKLRAKNRKINALEKMNKRLRVKNDMLNNALTLLSNVKNVE